MNTSPWVQLQTELRDLAFLLDRRGSHAAADLAATTAARIGELLAGETPALETGPTSKATKLRSR